ncbi:amidohydrolase family protein [Dokdonella sp.]|uniref:amidohydrolase family protein n=1 Tax=Dokdonella sp. TaxID=2291710 RepID=UPI003C44411B
MKSICKFRQLVILGLLLVGNSALAAPEYLELLDFHLIDGSGAAPRHVDRLVARDGVIELIGSAGQAPEPEPTARWTRVGLAGAWVMPGLIDTHVHVARFPNAHVMAEKILGQSVRGGVTSVRDLTGDARALAEIERATGTGELVAPNIVFSALFGGPDIFARGPTAEMASGRPRGEAPWAHVVTEDSDLRQLIAEAKGSGTKNIKVYGDLTPDLAERLIREGTRQGMLSTAHATVFPARPGDLVDAGVGSLSHAPYLVWQAVETVPDDYGQRIAGPWNEIPANHPALLDLYKSMAKHGVTLDATLYVYKSMQSYPGVPKMDWTEAAFKWGVQATRLANEAGVLVTTGTDWFEPRDDFELPHTHEELALLVEAAGFSPMQAIVAGTRNGAVALGLQKTHGTIEIGKVADLLVLDADPLEDIHNTTRIRFTVRNGLVVDPE